MSGLSAVALAKAEAAALMQTGGQVAGVAGGIGLVMLVIGLVGKKT